MADEEKDDNQVKIDTNQYTELYGYHDIKKYGRFRPLPDIEFKEGVREWIEEMRNNT